MTLSLALSVLLAGSWGAALASLAAFVLAAGSSRAQLAAERAKRQRAKATIADLWRRSHEDGVPAHLAPVVARVDRFFAEYRPNSGTRTTRLLMTAPPGAGKSELTRRIAAVAKARGLRVILLSYSGTLAAHHSKAVQSLVVEHYDGKLDRDLRGATRWALAGDASTMLASGLQGTATGFRADVVLIDDYCANLAEAYSTPHRERATQAIQAVARTRVEPGGLVMLVSTLWHPKDAGAAAIAAGYEVFRIPAITDAGESFWPSRYALDELRAIESEIGDRDFAALYMCEPRATDGQLFGDVHLISPEELASARIVARTGGLDLAYSDRSSADASVALVTARLDDRRVVVIDVLREQVPFEVLAPKFRAFGEQHGISSWRWRVGGQEATLARLLSREGVHVAAEATRGDKVTNAQGAASAWNRGRLLVLAGQPWTDRLVGEVCGFPSRRDDQVDALVSAFGGHPQPSVHSGRWQPQPTAPPRSYEGSTGFRLPPLEGDEDYRSPRSNWRPGMGRPPRRWE